MAATVLKFISLYFGQVAWLEGKNITESWKVSGKCFVVNVVGWTTFFSPPLGIFRRLGWYLQLLLWKQSGKEEQLVEGSCLLWPSFYEDSGEIKALTEERIVWCLLGAGLQPQAVTGHTRGWWLSVPISVAGGDVVCVWERRMVAVPCVCCGGHHFCHPQMSPVS